MARFGIDAFFPFAFSSSLIVDISLLNVPVTLSCEWCWRGSTRFESAERVLFVGHAHWEYQSAGVRPALAYTPPTEQTSAARGICYHASSQRDNTCVALVSSWMSGSDLLRSDLFHELLLLPKALDPPVCQQRQSFDSYQVGKACMALEECRGPKQSSERGSRMRGIEPAGVPVLFPGFSPLGSFRQSRHVATTRCCPFAGTGQLGTPLAFSHVRGEELSGELLPSSYWLQSMRSA